MQIDDLNAKIRHCKKCRLSESRINAVCGEGDLSSRIILVAQAPGENEDREGVMFIGPSGKVLDRLLKAADVDRGKLFMTNLIKCMLPGNRKPRKDEIETCSYYLDEEIRLMDPPVIAPLGYYATRYIFDKYKIPLPSKPEFHNVYGRLFLTSRKKVFPLQHPSTILYEGVSEPEAMKNYRRLKVLLTE